MLSYSLRKRSSNPSITAPRWGPCACSEAHTLSCEEVAHSLCLCLQLAHYSMVWTEANKVLNSLGLGFLLCEMRLMKVTSIAKVIVESRWDTGNCYCSVFFFLNLKCLINVNYYDFLQLCSRTTAKNSKEISWILDFPPQRNSLAL